MCLDKVGFEIKINFTHNFIFNVPLIITIKKTCNLNDITILCLKYLTCLCYKTFKLVTRKIMIENVLSTHRMNDK